MKDALTKANLPLATPSRGDNGKSGDAKTPGTTVANVARAGLYGRCREQGRSADVQGACKAVRAGVLVARSRRQPAQHWRQPQHADPRHQRADLNGRHQERRRQSCATRKALDELGLAASTNIIIASDHGFSTISKESKTSPAAKVSYEDTPKDFLPMGFLAIDLAKALNLPLFDPNNKNAPIATTRHPRAGNGVLGQDPAKPDIVIATNGGSDLVYLPNKDKKLAERAIKALLEQDYVSGLLSTTNSGVFPARCRCRNSD